MPDSNNEDFDDFIISEPVETNRSLIIDKAITDTAVEDGREVEQSGEIN
jgi:hypothetical protein